MTGDQRGFTLLETLVALLVLGFVVLGLAQGLRFGLAAWDRQSAAIDRDAALDSTYRLLRSLIEEMSPSLDQETPALVGSWGRVAFTSRLPAGAPGPMRLANVLLGVDPRHRLLLRWTPHMHAKVLTPAIPAETALLGGVAGIVVSYYRPASGGQSAGWVDQWNAPTQPELIRIHIQFQDAGRTWPD